MEEAEGLIPVQPPQGLWTCVRNGSDPGSTCISSDADWACAAGLQRKRGRCPGEGCSKEHPAKGSLHYSQQSYPETASKAQAHLNT